MSGFEDRLWKMLVDEHGADTATPASARSRPNRLAQVEADRHRWVRVAMRRSMALTAGAVGLAAAVAAAVVLIVSASATTTPAYALTQNPDGSVSVTIHDLQTAIPQLNARFRAMGIDETVLPITPGCTSGVQTQVAPTSLANDTFTFTPGRRYLDPGFDGVLAAGYSSSGQLLYFQGAFQPPLPTCVSATPLVLQPVPNGGVAGTMTSGS